MNMIMITISMVVSTFIIHLHQKNETAKLPKCVRLILIKYLARILLVPVNRKTDEKESNQSENSIPVKTDDDTENDPDKTGNWKILAAVINRAMFVIYLICVIAASIKVFPIT